MAIGDRGHSRAICSAPWKLLRWYMAARPYRAVDLVSNELVEIIRRYHEADHLPSAILVLGLYQSSCSLPYRVADIRSVAL
jgi:hypothetical protein